eukprot:TRINITY_DN3845_c0_g1_i2.p1 TRINITY_DN3845_c0_g1~~TRINITY_DN3845_c0_g1_i2.p1  ORF type:complete len:210 (+),score=104.84 TRINITY_DN3845_c0_g1_i2:91-630(+)
MEEYALSTSNERLVSAPMKQSDDEEGVPDWDEVYGKDGEVDDNADEPVFPEEDEEAEESKEKAEEHSEEAEESEEGEEEEDETPAGKYVKAPSQELLASAPSKNFASAFDKSKKNDRKRKVQDSDDDDDDRPQKEKRMTTNKKKSKNYYTDANVKNKRVRTNAVSKRNKKVRYQTLVKK